MGWRVSWYKADKEKPLNITFEKEYQYPNIEINGICLLYDSATDIWCHLKGKEDFEKEIVCLFEDDDCDYYSITKNGLKMLILEIRERIINHLKKVIELAENPELKEKDEFRYIQDPLALAHQDLREWEYCWTGEDDEKHFLNITLNTPVDEIGISRSWMYKYGIYDLIEMYKYFDWENYVMVVYGG